MIATNNVYNDVISNFFNGFGDLFRFAVPTEKSQTGLRIGTDIKEFEERYELDMELPGFDKKEVKIELKNGYLTVLAAHEEKTEEKSDNNPEAASEETTDTWPKFIRRERYAGSYARSIYLGNAISKEDIKAAFSNGILKITIPKEALLPKDTGENSIEIGD